MTDPTAAARNKAMRERKKAQGLVKVELWLTPKEKERVKAFIKKVRSSEK